MKWIRDVLKAVSPSRQVAGRARDEDHEVYQGYTAIPRGIPAIGFRELVDAPEIASLLTRIRGAFGFEREVYGRLIHPLIDRYIRFVHLAPATENEHHRGQGGLLAHGLEVAYFALRRSESLYVHDDDPSLRRKLDDLWRVGAFTCGLLHDIGKPYTDYLVVDRDGNRWSPYLGPLTDWLSSNGIERYWIRFETERPDRHHAVGQVCLSGFLHRELIEWFELTDLRMLREMQGALSSHADDYLLGRLVKQADRDSVAGDARNVRDDEIAMGAGESVAQYLQDILRSLVEDGVWTLNEPGAVVWVIDGDAYVVWTRAVGDIEKRIAQDGVPWSGKNPLALARILVDSGYAAPLETRTGILYLWPIRPEPVEYESYDALRPVRIRDLLGTTRVESVSGEVGGKDGATERAALPRVSSRDGVDRPGSRPDGEPDSPSDANVSRRETDAPADEAVSDDLRQALGEFAGQCESAAFVARIVADLLDGETRAASALGIQGRQVVLFYPEPLEPYGKPQEILSLFDADGWIDMDPMHPGLQVREADERLALYLPRGPSRALIPMISGRV